MSAYIMQDNEFAMIAAFMENRGYIQRGNMPAVARQLKRINVQSVNYRYKEKTVAKPIPLKLIVNAPIVQADSFIRLVECWDYQSCEDDNNIDYTAWSLALSGVVSNLKAREG